MEKVVANAKVDSNVRRQALEILIDSDSPNLQLLCVELLKDPDLNVLAVRGLAQYEDIEIGKNNQQSGCIFEG